jgi:hypothetical protein
VSAAACPVFVQPIDECSRLRTFEALRDAGRIEEARAIARATWPGQDMPPMIVWAALADEHRADYTRQQALTYRITDSARSTVMPLITRRT